MKLKSGRAFSFPSHGFVFVPYLPKLNEMASCENLWVYSYLCLIFVRPNSRSEKNRTTNGCFTGHQSKKPIEPENKEK